MTPAILQEILDRVARHGNTTALVDHARRVDAVIFTGSQKEADRLRSDGRVIALSVDRPDLAQVLMGNRRPILIDPFALTPVAKAWEQDRDGRQAAERREAGLREDLAMESAALRRAVGRADRLQERLNDLLEPVDGVDPDEVLAICEQDESEPTEGYWSGEGDDFHLSVAGTHARALAREVVVLRASSTKLVDEVARLTESGAQETAYREAAEGQVARLRAELEEQRLTLAAEQGIPEGAPSPSWAWIDDGWSKTYPTGHQARVTAPHRAPIVNVFHPTEPHRRFAQPTMRAAMKACDAPHLVPPSSESAL